MMEWFVIIGLLIVNIFSGLYCRFLLKNLVSLSESTKDMRVMFDGFRSHVESLHEMEMFYGDQTLQAMIDHANFVVEQIDQYEEALSLTDQKEEGQSREEKED